VEVTAALKPGGNASEIRVTDLWVNRLIGGRHTDAAKKYHLYGRALLSRRFTRAAFRPHWGRCRV
jgi:hypothetical protein